MYIVTTAKLLCLSSAKVLWLTSVNERHPIAFLLKTLSMKFCSRHPSGIIVKIVGIESGTNDRSCYQPISHLWITGWRGKLCGFRKWSGCLDQDRRHCDCWLGISKSHTNPRQGRDSSCHECWRNLLILHYIGRAFHPLHQRSSHAGWGFFYKDCQKQWEQISFRSELLPRSYLEWICELRSG